MFPKRPFDHHFDHDMGTGYFADRKKPKTDGNSFDSILPPSPPSDTHDICHASITNLPNEILRQIIDIVAEQSYADVKSFSMACKTFRAVVSYLPASY